MRSILSFVLLLVGLLASRVAALTVDVGGTLGNISAADFLDITDSYLATSCLQTTQCSAGNKALAACTTDACFCSNTTVSAVLTCEQCMFNALIAQDLPMPDPRAGSRTALTAYQTACTDADITVSDADVTLTLPTDWDGPFGQSLSLPATIFTVIIAAALGSGSIWIICTM